MEHRSPALQVDCLPAEPHGKSKNTGVGIISLLQQIFLSQELNQGLLHCRWLLYQLSFSFQFCASVCDLLCSDTGLNVVTKCHLILNINNFLLALFFGDKNKSCDPSLHTRRLKWIQSTLGITVLEQGLAKYCLFL